MCNFEQQRIVCAMYSFGPRNVGGPLRLRSSAGAVGLLYFRVLSCGREPGQCHVRIALKQSRNVQLSLSSGVVTAGPGASVIELAVAIEGSRQRNSIVALVEFADNYCSFRYTSPIFSRIVEPLTPQRAALAAIESTLVEAPDGIGSDGICAPTAPAGARLLARLAA